MRTCEPNDLNSHDSKAQGYTKGISPDKNMEIGGRVYLLQTTITQTIVDQEEHREYEYRVAIKKLQRLGAGRIRLTSEATHRWRTAASGTVSAAGTHTTKGVPKACQVYIRSKSSRSRGGRHQKVPEAKNVL